MRNKIFLLISFCLIFIFNVNAQKLKWSTYFGGNGDEQATAVTTDPEGNIYMTGWTSSTGLSTNGTAFGGFYDAFISKFSSNGKLLWSTYYGGSGIENSFGIAIDKYGSIYICGSTTGSDGIATNGAYQTALGGFTDGFLAKFDNNGTRIWSTYYGGSENDQASGISTDSNGNVYITGFTLSANGIATAGAYNTSYSGTRDNGFLAKFDSSGSIIWATYYGGNKNDYSNCVANDHFGNVYIAGNCSSSYGIATAGAFRTSVGGFYDGFLAKFTDKGDLLWGTYFGGDGDDECTGIATDMNGNVIITGNTSSDNGIATKGEYQTIYSGGYDAFVAKFNGNGAIQWSTYYGGTGNDFAYGIDVGTGQNISITGYTNSGQGIATSDAYQISLSGMNDGFAGQFSKDGNLIWATYFGGSENDYAYGITSDLLDNLYIAGVTSSTSGIASNGAYSDTLSGSTDAFLAKFTSPVSAIQTESKIKDKVQVFPNPVSDYTTITYTIREPGFVNMELFDVNGKLITQLVDEMQTPGNYNYEWDISKYRLKAGSYFIKTSSGSGKYSTEIVKQ